MTVELVPHIFGATARYPIGQRGLRNMYGLLSGDAEVTNAAVSVNILRPDFGGHADDTEGTCALAA